ELSFPLRERHGEGGLGAAGELLECLRQRGPAGQIAPGDAHELIASPAPQLRHEVGFGAGRVGRGRGPGGVVRARQPPLEIAAAQQLGEQLRIAGAGVGDEVAGGKHGGERVAHGGRGGDERVAIGRVGEQRLEGAREKAGELGTDPRGRAQFQMLPPRSWKVDESRRLRPIKCESSAYTCAPSEASIEPASPSIRLLSMCTFAWRGSPPPPVALMWLLVMWISQPSSALAAALSNSWLWLSMCFVREP